MLPIISAIRNEDDKIFVENTYMIYKERWYLTAYAILNSSDEANECVGETVCKLIGQLERIRDMSEIDGIAYMLIICRNVALDKYRRNRRKSEYEQSTNCLESRAVLDIVDRCAFVDNLLENEETLKKVEQIIEELPQMYRSVMNFKMTTDMTNRQMADALNVSSHRIEVWLNRARNRIIERLDEMK